MDEHKKWENLHVCSKLHDSSVVNHGQLSLILIPYPKLSKNVMILLSLEQCCKPRENLDCELKSSQGSLVLFYTFFLQTSVLKGLFFALVKF
jgi:hypothetical protein